MFLATNKKTTGDYPRNCSFSENDWHILASFWHPVAFSHEVQSKPTGARLLDVDLVLYRTKSGIVAAKNVCIHRGAALSLGWMDDANENIVCAFHGLHFDHSGQCTKIPSLPDQSKAIPKVLKINVFKSIERYGIIWVCLKDEPVHPLPEWKLLETDDPQWLSVELVKGNWKASASRHCENFNDIAHLAWVHIRTFGNRNRPEVPNYQLDRTEYGLKMIVPYLEVERGFFDAGLGERELSVLYTHMLTYPFATDLQADYESGEHGMVTTHFYDIGSPISASETAIFQIVQTNMPNVVADDYRSYQSVVNEEDVSLVESQKPEEVPLNIAEEIHIPADKFSIQYRKELVNRFGLGAPEFTG